MRKFLWLILVAVPAMAQVSNPQIVIVSSDPSGAVSCSFPWRWNALGSGSVWYPGSPSGGSCTWTQIGSGSGSGGTGGTLIAASGDTTCAADTTAIQAAITASQTSGAGIILGPGNFYINSLTVGGPISMTGQGGKGTILNYCGTTGNAFTLAYSTTATGNLAQSETFFGDFSLYQKTGVTPTAGYGFAVSNGGSGYLAELHIERVAMEGLWEPIYLGTGLINNWITNDGIANCISGIGIEYNTPTPGGDLFGDGISMTSSNTTNHCNLQIDQADTAEFTNLKLNGGAGIVFARTAPAVRVRFVDPSIEGTSNLPNCSVNWGTTGSNAASSIEFVGGAFGLSPYVFCNGATVSGASDAGWVNSYGTVYYSGTGFGVTPASSSAGTTIYNPITVSTNVGSLFTGNGAVTFNDPVVMNSGSSYGGTTLTLPSAPNAIASADYSTELIDGTVGGTVTGSAASAGLGFRIKVTGTQQDWVFLGGNGTSINSLRVYDNGNAGSGGGGDAMDFLPGGYTETFKPPLYVSQTVIASATTIAPTAPTFHVSGVTSIATITAPAGCATASTMCQITIIPDGVFATTTAGNIAIISTAVVSKALIMTYDPATSKWYPSY